MTTGIHAPPRVAVERFSASEPGAWSNSYLISDSEEALLFDVFQLRSDAKQLADSIEASGKKLGKVWISHAHPDHFLQLDLIGGCPDRRGTLAAVAPRIDSYTVATSRVSV